MRVPVRKHGKPTGFTLVEMAIVLVIIGIILAGVMKGRDIVRSSQVKQFAQSYAQKWVTIAQTYYDKSGQHLTDGVINGGSAASSDGRMDGIIVGPQGTGGLAAGVQTSVMLALKTIGIDPCTIVKTDMENLTQASMGAAGGCEGDMNPFSRSVDGEITGKVAVGVGFKAFTITQNTLASVRNTVYLVDVPLDVAMALDTILDGSARGDQGSVIYTGSVAANQNGVVAAWRNGNSAATAITATAWPSYTTSNVQYVDPVLVLDN